MKPASNAAAGDEWIVEVCCGQVRDRMGRRALFVLAARPLCRGVVAVSWREREARNEARFRTQNEWVDQAGSPLGALLAFVCECGDGECGQTIHLTSAEYELVRATSNRFAVARDHENPECEVVISECERFAAIDKIEGWGLRIARETDPRSSSGWQDRTPA
jgi:hypothetical protein